MAVAEGLSARSGTLLRCLNKATHALKVTLQENNTLVSMCSSYRVVAACTAESANMADVVTEVLLFTLTVICRCRLYTFDVRYA